MRRGLDGDPDPDAVILAPIAAMILVIDEVMIGTVIIPITAVIMRPGVVIMRHRLRYADQRKDGNGGQQQKSACCARHGSFHRDYAAQPMPDDAAQ